jgi:TolA-binding protein
VRIVATDGAVLRAQLRAGETWNIDEPAPRSAQVRLDRALLAFTNRDCKSAVQHARAALDDQPTRPQTAEARTILAECAQAAGRAAEAVRLYDTIAIEFRDLPAGETALVAAARIDLARGRTREARARFETYVERYPKGRLLDDAKHQLEVLQP